MRTRSDRLTGHTPPNLASSDSVRIVSQARVWQGRFAVDVVEFRQRRFDGDWSGLRRWELLRRGAAAAVLPYDPWSDRVLLIEQFRLPAHAAGLDPVMVELPAGLCDPGEDAEDTVRREMVEETGLAVDRVERVGDFLLTPGGADERVALFAGRLRLAEPSGPSGSFGLAAEQEDIRARIWSAEAAIEDAVAGRFPNSVTAIGLLWLAARRVWLRAQWT